MSSDQALASRLLQAYRSREALDVLPESGPASIEQAYAVQRRVWQAMSHVARPAFWKVGAPNRSTTPTAAAVFPQRVVHCVAAKPALLQVDDFRSLGIEAEIAVCFGRNLPARTTPYNAEEISAAIDSVHVAVELVDTRLADPEAAGPLWRLADNLLNGGLLVGEAITNWSALDFANLNVRVEANDQILAYTLGRQPLDDLFYCLPWWIAHNNGAMAGDIVTTGAWNGMHPIGLPSRARVEFIDVGSVSLRVGE